MDNMVKDLIYSEIYWKVLAHRRKGHGESSYWSKGRSWWHKSWALHFSLQMHSSMGRKEEVQVLLSQCFILPLCLIERHNFWSLECLGNGLDYCVDEDTYVKNNQGTCPRSHQQSSKTPALELQLLTPAQPAFIMIQ